MQWSCFVVEAVAQPEPQTSQPIIEQATRNQCRLSEQLKLQSLEDPELAVQPVDQLATTYNPPPFLGFDVQFSLGSRGLVKYSAAMPRMQPSSQRHRMKVVISGNWSSSPRTTLQCPTSSLLECQDSLSKPHSCGRSPMPCQEDFDAYMCFGCDGPGFRLFTDSDESG